MISFSCKIPSCLKYDVKKAETQRLILFALLVSAFCYLCYIVSG